MTSLLSSSRSVIAATSTADLVHRTVRLSGARSRASAGAGRIGAVDLAEIGAVRNRAADRVDRRVPDDAVPPLGMSDGEEPPPVGHAQKQEALFIGRVIGINDRNR